MRVPTKQGLPLRTPGRVSVTSGQGRLRSGRSRYSDWVERVSGNSEEKPVFVSLRSAGAVAFAVAQAALGLLVGWEVGVLPLRFSLGWIRLSFPAVVLLAALGVRVRILRPFLWTSAVIGSLTIVYSIGLSVALGSMS